MRKRLKLIVPLAVVLIGAGLYFTVLSEPESVAKPRIDGEVYVLPKEFLVNLREGRYAKVTVALVLHHGALDVGGGHGAAPEPPEGFGPLPQEAVIRDLVTEELTGSSADDLISAAGRKRVKSHLLHAIEKKTDVHAERVLLTDVAVQ